MADIDGVAETLASNIAGFLRNEDGTPKNGAQTRIFAGWPKANDLKAALAADQVFISVFPNPGASSNTTRHEAKWRDLTPSIVTTTTAIDGRTVTFGGTITLPLNIGISMAGVRVVYQAKEGDALADLASGVAAVLEAAGVTAVATGPSVTIESGGDFQIKLGSAATIVREAYRTKQVYMITIWAPSQALRKATAEALEGNFFAQTSVQLDDLTYGMLLFQHSTNSDSSEIEGLYRRDIYASVEFSVFEFDESYDVVVTSEVTQSVAFIDH